MDLGGYTVQLRNSDGSGPVNNATYQQAVTNAWNFMTSLASSTQRDVRRAANNTFSITAVQDPSDSGVSLNMTTTTTPPLKSVDPAGFASWQNLLAAAWAAFDSDMQSFVVDANNYLSSHGSQQYIVVLL